MGASHSITCPVILKTAKGNLKGIEEMDASGKPVLRRYTRVPFAQPPVGELRWRRPLPLPADYSFSDKSGEPGNYTQFGAICPQPDGNLESFFVDNPSSVPPAAHVQSEDCLFLNIWVPVGQPLLGGWPVQIHIHGGYLQFGNACQDPDCDPFHLLRDSAPRIIVAVTYRLNLFGFLAGEEMAATNQEPAAGNYGFWDQRCALEWVYNNISLFGGSRDNITLGGLSAGGYSAYFQLYYDAFQPTSRRYLKQVYLRSNALAIQPPTVTSSKLTSQFVSLCSVLDIAPSLSASEKVARLRAVPFEDLVAAIPKLEYHTFRACSDAPFSRSGFVPPTFLASLNSGSFAARLSENNTRIMVGEVSDEGLLYKEFYAPNSRQSLVRQLCNFYPRAVVDALVALPLYNIPQDADDADEAYWKDIFGTIVADCQVYAPIRGLTRCLLSPPEHEGRKPVPPANFFRYRIAWRAKSMDKWLLPSLGVCHAMDTPIWWASGWRCDFSGQDKAVSQKAFLEPFGRFVSGEADIGWGGDGSENTLRNLSEDGVVIEGWADQGWERGLKVWDAVWNAQRESVERGGD